MGDGNRSSGVERTDRRLDPAGGGYRHAAVRRLLWSSADGPCLGARWRIIGGRESGSQTITLSPWGVDDPLLSGLPATFPAHLSHLQTVTRLPEGATVLAASSHDPHQIVRYGPHAVSTQFHPEFTAPIARSLIRHREAVLQAEGIDAQRLHDEVQESPQGAAILTRFVSAFLTPYAPGH